MHLKKTIAALAVTGSLAGTGVAVTGTATAWASTPVTSTTAATVSPNTYWTHPAGDDYATYDECYANGISALVEGEFGGPWIAFKCVFNGNGGGIYPWELWLESRY